MTMTTERSSIETATDHTYRGVSFKLYPGTNERWVSYSTDRSIRCQRTFVSDSQDGAIVDMLDHIDAEKGVTPRRR